MSVGGVGAGETGRPDEAEAVEATAPGAGRGAAGTGAAAGAPGAPRATRTRSVDMQGIGLRGALEARLAQPAEDREALAALSALESTLDDDTLAATVMLTQGARAAARAEGGGGGGEADSLLTSPQSALARRRDALDPSPAVARPLDVALAAFDDAPAGGKPSVKALTDLAHRAFGQTEPDDPHVPRTEILLAVHVVADHAIRRGNTPAASDALGKVDKLVSTSFLDWKVTDADRDAAAGILSSLPADEFMFAVGELARRELPPQVAGVIDVAKETRGSKASWLFSSHHPTTGAYDPKFPAIFTEKAQALGLSQSAASLLAGHVERNFPHLPKVGRG